MHSLLSYVLDGSCEPIILQQFFLGVNILFIHVIDVF